MADVEVVMLESINTNVHVVTETFGGTFGAEEARMVKQSENQAYAMADVVVKARGMEFKCS